MIFPINYPERLESLYGMVEYYNFNEICQGGPEVGNIRISEKPYKSSLKFGGPAIIFQNNLYIPKFISRRFVLVKICLKTLEEKELTEPLDLILIKEIKDSELIFFMDLKNTRERKVSIN